MTEKESNQQIWETVQYTDNPELPAEEDIEQVKDFLPKQEDLVFRSKGIQPNKPCEQQNT